MPKFDVDVTLSSGVNGNAGAIMAKVSRALKQAGATQQQLKQYREESTSGDYNNVIQTAMRWVNVE